MGKSFFLNRRKGSSFNRIDLDADKTLFMCGCSIYYDYKSASIRMCFLLAILRLRSNKLINGG